VLIDFCVVCLVVSPLLSVSDGLLSQEKEDLVERVAYLEKKTTQQEDEIVCLKSAMADVIRRLAQLESSESNKGLALSWEVWKIGTQHWPPYCFNQSGSYFSAVKGIGIE
jgi:hypothetical protein